MWYNHTSGWFELIQRWRCAYCGKTTEVKQKVPPGCQAYIEAWPKDTSGSWSRFHDQFICNDHKVSIDLKIDSQSVKSLPHQMKPDGVEVHGLDKH